MIICSRHRLLRLLVMAVLASTFAAQGAGSDESFPQKAIPVDQHWQLFLDDYVIDRGTGFDRVIHHPRAMGVVIPSDKPWETVMTAPGFFSRGKDGTFVAFYYVVWWAPEQDNKKQPDKAQQYTGGTAYATSKDGIHWE